MEAFESFAALALEADGLVVSEAVKFPVTRQTRRVSHTEIQTHHYEVDLVGARADKLVLATVKSFFGSRGVVAAQVKGTDNSRWDRLYAMINDPVIRDAVLAGASERFGYSTAQIELRLYVGKFAGGSRRIMKLRSVSGQRLRRLVQVRSTFTASRGLQLRHDAWLIRRRTETTRPWWRSRCSRRPAC